jgi:hypothetical protein
MRGIWKHVSTDLSSPHKVRERIKKRTTLSPCEAIFI